MIRKTSKILALLILAVMFCTTGCKGVKDITVNSVELESLSTKGLKSMDLFLKVEVDNPAKQVKISEVDGSLKHSGKIIGKLAMDPFILGAKTSDVYILKATISLAEGAGLKDFMVLMDKKGLERCTVDISAMAVYGKTAKMHINKKDIPLKKLLDKIENEKN